MAAKSANCSARIMPKSGAAWRRSSSLPELFVNVIAFHHDAGRLAKLVPNAALREGTLAAALLPHAPNVWNREDAGRLAELLGRRRPPVDLASFVAQVQTELARHFFSYFHEGRIPDGKLPDLLAKTAPRRPTTPRVWWAR